MICAVVGEKGGTGKSIIATSLAGLRAASGRDVLLIDTDTQGSASGWQAVRSGNEKLAKVHCIAKFGKTLSTEVKDLASRYQDIVIDAGGRDSVEMRAAMLVAEVAVLPFQPATFDLWTVRKMHELLEMGATYNPNIRALAVINQGETNAFNTDFADALELIQEFPGIELLEKAICKRLAFKRAAREGMTVVEFENDPESKAVREITRLYKAVFAD